MEKSDEDNALLTISKLGEILELEKAGQNKPYLWVKVQFEEVKPLHPGFHLPCENQSMLCISFKYERLSSFCFTCGRINHTMGNCSKQVPHEYQQELRDDLRGAPLYVLSKFDIGMGKPNKGSMKDNNNGGQGRRLIPPQAAVYDVGGKDIVSRDGLMMPEDGQRAGATYQHNKELCTILSTNLTACYQLKKEEQLSCSTKLRSRPILNKLEKFENMGSNQGRMNMNLSLKEKESHPYMG